VQVSQKCQYALRAVFELARHYGQGPVRISAIAEAQAIPPRFLEVILSQLKQGRFVESRRGKDGGYLLTRQPRQLTVGQVVRFVEGPIGPVGCVDGEGADQGCPLHGSCVFMALWERAQKAVAQVYDSTTFQDLLQEEARMQAKFAPSYVI
jgi:Rrf2 family cysteine metabolism transcriptional repressor